MSASHASPDSWWQVLLSTLPTNSCHQALTYFANESLSIDDAPAIYPLHHYGLIDISGPDASKFLQGQLTADVDALTAGNSTLSAHCDPKGRMHSSFTLHCVTDDHYLLHMPLAVIPIALAALNKYAVFSKATLVDLSEDYAAFASSKLNDQQQLLITDDDSFTLCANIISEESTHKEAINNIGLIHWVKRTAANKFVQQINSASNPPHWRGAAQWEYRLIDAGIGFVQLQTVGEFIPQMLNFDYLNGISFTKGCYTGQEIIARLKYRGQVKRRCYGIEINSDVNILPGAELLNEQGKSLGNIVSSVANPASAQDADSNLQSGHMAGLAVLKVASISEQTQLTLKDDPQASVRIEVKALPYAINNSDAAN